ncbi:MAG: hypothetical protein JXA54_09775 [Candidatus Heimdallarchaeota archaeon]|nr:hypothetical protein [Candidatus Heimdallarchaeota archaeon]
MKTRRFVFWLAIIIFAIGLIILIEFIGIQTAYYAPFSFDPNSYNNSTILILIFQPIIIFFGASLFYLIYSKRKKERMEQSGITYDVYVNEIIYDVITNEPNSE